MWLLIVALWGLLCRELTDCAVVTPCADGVEFLLQLIFVQYDFMLYLLHLVSVQYLQNMNRFLDADLDLIGIIKIL